MRWVLPLLAAVGGMVVVGVLVLVATTANESLVLDLRPGDCFDLDDVGDGGDDGIGTVATVDCERPHEAEVAATGRLNEARDVERPSDDELFAEVDARCAAALRDRAGLVERFGILPVVADEASWESYRGAYVCVAIPYGGGTTTGSALSAGAGG